MDVGEKDERRGGSDEVSFDVVEEDERLRGGDEEDERRGGGDEEDERRCSSNKVSLDVSEEDERWGDNRERLGAVVR